MSLHTSVPARQGLNQRLPALRPIPAGPTILYVQLAAEYHQTGIDHTPSEQEKLFFAMQGPLPMYVLAFKNRPCPSRLGELVAHIEKKVLTEDSRLHDHRLVNLDIRIGEPVVCANPQYQKMVIAWLSGELGRDLKAARRRGADLGTIAGIERKISFAMNHAREEVCISCAWTSRRGSRVRVLRPPFPIAQMLDREFLEAVERLA